MTPIEYNEKFRFIADYVISNGNHKVTHNSEKTIFESPFELYIERYISSLNEFLEIEGPDKRIYTLHLLDKNSKKKIYKAYTDAIQYAFDVINRYKISEDLFEF